MNITRTHLTIRVVGEHTEWNREAILSFWFLLPINETVSPVQFAEMIERAYSIENPVTRLLVDHLRTAVLPI